ncbi:MAG: polyribonucleotide nucleotidyltransferase [Candidatus Omnitrophica bacterium]|nr:polyribonucleotide nucleotidyltransferase [Candidatus Omnitrophota bacterium]
MEFSASVAHLGKSTLTFSTGRVAKQANGSVSVSYGDTHVLVTACMSKEPRNMGYFPLMCEYQEKSYAMGKIPGGFIKKEGRPKDWEILGARMIDRPIRPLFPKGFMHEVQVVAMVLSSDGVNDPDVLAINGASCALMLSDIPFARPIAAVRVSRVGEDLLVNPTYKEREQADMDMIVVGTDEKIVMIEAACKEIAESDVEKGFEFAKTYIQKIVNVQKELQAQAGKEKLAGPFAPSTEELTAKVKAQFQDKIAQNYGIEDKAARKEKSQEVCAAAVEYFAREGLLVEAGEEAQEGKVTEGQIKDALEAAEEEYFRRQVLEKEQRPDGRGVADIRAIDCAVRTYPRPHGTALFTRGQTQALAVTTLGTSSDEQMIEALEGERAKHFMLHYAFPPFSVGEVKMMRGPSRRDIGHGALAEKALVNMIPPKEDFPYTMRVVSEILESNGSSSMATVCAASLSLMDAGVPIKAPVAGIALGLVQEGENYKVLTDIAGIEDHCGDMDFKIAGTTSGITAIQLDVKIDGLSAAVIHDALQRAKQARLHILEKMQQALELPRAVVSKYAPKIQSFPIDPDKIGNVIGPGGRMIRKISRDYNVEIDIDDEHAKVFIVAQTQEDLKNAVNYVQGLTKDAEPGEIYEGKVVRLSNFGAFCEILPGKTGLVHISEVSDDYVKDIREVLKEGDAVKVKVINIDQQGRINLSIKKAK